MTHLVSCIPCRYGCHEDHVEVVQAVQDGVMGGARCPCEGECVEHYQPLKIMERIAEVHHRSAIDLLDVLDHQ